jgi:N-methyl-L-tryptophan oxidase
MSNHYEVIVIGAGAMGMAAGFFLAKQGGKVLLIDKYDPPHSNGSHHGDTRMIRHAYSAGHQYVPLVLRAQKLWTDLEEESGRKLFYQTGVLRVGEQGSLFIEKQIEVAKQFSLSLHVMSADQIEKQWKGLSIPENYVGCFEESSGVLLCEEAIRAYRDLAMENGARLLSNTEVSAIYFNGNGGKVETDKGGFFFDRLIVTAGAWTKELCISLSLPLQPIHKSIVWLEADESLYTAQHFPPFVFDTPVGQYYGMPSMFGSGVKIGRNDGGQSIHPDELQSLSPDVSELLSFSGTYFPFVTTKVKRAQTCLYNMTPDEHFIIDRHPLYPHVLLATGFSGHGFKFASAVGEILSELAMGETPIYDLALFSLSRFGCQACSI